MSVSLRILRALADLADITPHAAGRGEILHQGRLVRDGFATGAEAAALLAMLRRAFARSTVAAGPTLADVNSGLLRDSERGVQRLYAGAGAVNFSAASENAMISVGHTKVKSRG
jgi:hypothetical protein